MSEGPLALPLALAGVARREWACVAAQDMLEGFIVEASRCASAVRLAMAAAPGQWRRGARAAWRGVAAHWPAGRARRCAHARDGLVLTRGLLPTAPSEDGSLIIADSRSRVMRGGCECVPLCEHSLCVCVSLLVRINCAMPGCGLPSTLAGLQALQASLDAKHKGMRASGTLIPRRALPPLQLGMPVVHIAKSAHDIHGCQSARGG